MARKRTRQIIRVATVAISATLAVGAGKLMHPGNDPGTAPLRQQAGFLMSREGSTTASSGTQRIASASFAAGISTPAFAPAPGAGGAPSPAASPVPAEPALPVATGSPDAAIVAPPRNGEERPETPFLYVDGKPACPADLKVTAVPGGMAYLSFDAPCQRGKPVGIGHAGLRVDVAVPVSGRLAQILPVFDPLQPFTVTLLDGVELDTKLPETSANAFDHVVLQWTGPAGLNLHAMEFGAQYGDAGHVWLGAPKEALRGIRGEGGFLTRVGDPRLGGVAEIYSFPAGQMARLGAVDLSIEASVTAGNCGQDVQAQVLRRGLGGTVEPLSLVIAVPDCDAVGDILVLKNILPDLKIAVN